jgi:translocation and assembly module TamB
MPRWLKIFIGIAVFGFVALATSPWWLIPSARPLLKRWHVTLGHYERLSYTRFRIDEVRFERDNTTVIARGVETHTPLLLAINSRARDISVESWLVDVRKSTSASSEPGRIVGMPSLHALLTTIAGYLDRWLTHAQIGPGEVRWPLGGLTLQRAEWRDHTLEARGLNFLKQTGDLTLTTPTTDATFTADARFAGDEAKVRARWSGAQVAAEGTLWSQPFTIRAEFPEAEWMPREASAKADHWDLAADRVKLAAQYDRVTGSGTFEWRDNAFTVAAHAQASPKPDVKSPNLSGRIEARGDRQAITISSFQIDAPFAKARLSAPVVIGFDGTPRGNPATLSLDADLSQQPWLASRGSVKGNLSVRSIDAPIVFQLQLEQISIGDFKLARATTRGEWQWPRLTLETFEAQLDATSTLSARGSIDWEARTVANGEFNAALSREWFAPWLPPEITWKKMATTATVEGTFDALRHAGSVTLERADTRVIKPFDLQAEWNGAGRALEKFSANILAGSAQLTVAGSGDETGIDLRELNLISLGAEPLALTQPARIDWSSALSLTGLSLRNETSSLQADFTSGAQTSFKLSAQHFDKEWLGQWLDIPGPTWIVSQLQATGNTVENVLNFSVALSGEIKAPQQSADVTVLATGDARGVAITELKLTDGDRVLTNAQGTLPFHWVVRGTPHFRRDDSAPLKLEADVLADSPLWPAVAEPLGLTVTGATAHATLGGNLKQPQGELRVDIESLKVGAGARYEDLFPDLAGFTLRASAARNVVKIDALSAKIEGQLLQASAQLPMNDGRWSELLTKPREFNWDDAEGTIEIPDADLTPIARRLPSLVAAQGQLKAKLALTRGSNLSGSLELTNAATRPISGLGTVQEINATIVFAEREAIVQSFTGKIGGEPVTLEGTIKLPRQAEPNYALKLAGKNLPLVRQAGLLLRSDLDLRATTGANGITRVAGLVTLRDGLVLSDLEALLPSGTRGVTRRPPYFAIEKAPFSQWQLAIEVRGKNAVRVRTPVFTGNASAHFDLSGTLGEPRAIGEVTIDRGVLFFPFATFTVQSGAVRLRASDPFTPQINVNAISRRHNFELRLEVSGTPDAPALTFSSNPPLEASEVLLMVMAGQMPANEAAGTTAQGGIRLGQIGAYLGQGIYRGLGGTGENRLEIVSGEQISRQGRETYEVAYKLGEKWSLVGEYDQFDSYNAGFKWRIYTQEGDNEKK